MLTKEVGVQRLVVDWISIVEGCCFYHTQGAIEGLLVSQDSGYMEKSNLYL